MPPDTEALPTLPHDPLPPESYLPGPSWWHLGLMFLVGFIAFTLILIVIIRRLRRALLTPIAPADPLALAKTNLTDLDPTQESGTVATQCSLTLRECLHQLYHETILFETEEELKQRKDSLAPLSETLRSDFISHLHELSEAKYAPSRQDEKQAKDYIERSQQLLEKLSLERSSTAKAPKTISKNSRS